MKKATLITIIIFGALFSSCKKCYKCHGYTVYQYTFCPKEDGSTVTPLDGAIGVYSIQHDNTVDTMSCDVTN